MITRGARIGWSIFSLFGATIFALIWWFSVFAPVHDASRLASEGVQTTGTVTEAWSVTQLRTGRVRWKYVIQYAGRTAFKSSHSRKIAVGDRLPVLYLRSDPDVVAVGRRGESKELLTERERGPLYSPAFLTIFYGILFILALWMCSLGVRRPKTADQRTDDQP